MKRSMLGVLAAGAVASLLGSTAFAVRLPAVASSATLLAGLYVLIADVLRDRRLALASIVCASTLPAISAGAVLMTIDPPFLACWCWALACLNRASNRRSNVWWLLAGVCTALGVLAKYPMLLLPAAAIGHLLVYRRSELRRGGVWLPTRRAAAGSPNPASGRPRPIEDVPGPV